MPKNRKAKQMAISRNGWDVFTSSKNSRLVNFPWVTGRVRGGDHFVVLNYIAERFHNEVEPIIRPHSWAWAYRDVRGVGGIISEHATGTAVDFNAPAHPIGKRNTFNAADRAKIRQIMKDVRGAARWGGEWSRPDDMHFELIGGNAKVKEVADLIRAGKLPGIKGNVTPAAPKPTPAKPAPKPATVEANSGNSKAENKAIAELLNSLGYKAGNPDGVPGPYLQAGVKAFQLAANKWGGAKFTGDGDWGPLTQRWFEWVRDELQRNVGLWQASQDLGKLRRDGDYAKLTNQHVAALQRRNPKRYKGLVDGKAQAMTCKAFDIKPFVW